MAERPYRFPGAPTGDYNCRFTVPGYGKYYVRTVSLTFGKKIISNEASGASRRAFYPVATIGDRFSMDVVFPTVSGRDRFNEWMSGYYRQAVGNSRGSGYIITEVPVREFARYSVPDPSSPLTYGESFDDVTYPMTLGFIGAHDPVNTDLGGRGAGASYFYLPDEHGLAKYFYPAAQQVAGSAALESAVYDGNLVNPPPPPSLPPPKPPPPPPPTSHPGGAQ